MALLYPSPPTFRSRADGPSHQVPPVSSGVIEDSVDSETAELIAQLAIQDLEALLEATAVQDEGKGKGRADAEVPRSDKALLLQAQMESFEQLRAFSEGAALSRGIQGLYPDAGTAALLEGERAREEAFAQDRRMAKMLQEKEKETLLSISDELLARSPGGPDRNEATAVYLEDCIREEAIAQDRRMAEMLQRGEALPPPSLAQWRMGEGSLAHSERGGPQIPVSNPARPRASSWDVREWENPLADTLDWESVCRPWDEDLDNTTGLMRPLVPVPDQGSSGGSVASKARTANWTTTTEDDFDRWYSLAGEPSVTSPNNALGGAPIANPPIVGNVRVSNLAYNPAVIPENDAEKWRLIAADVNHSGKVWVRPPASAEPTRAANNQQRFISPVEDEEFERLMEIFAEVNAVDPGNRSREMPPVAGPSSRPNE